MVYEIIYFKNRYGSLFNFCIFGWFPEADPETKIHVNVIQKVIPGKLTGLWASGTWKGRKPHVFTEDNFVQSFQGALEIIPQS